MSPISLLAALASISYVVLICCSHSCSDLVLARYFGSFQVNHCSLQVAPWRTAEPAAPSRILNRSLKRKTTSVLHCRSCLWEKAGCETSSPSPEVGEAVRQVN